VPSFEDGPEDGAAELGCATAPCLVDAAIEAAVDATVGTAGDARQLGFSPRPAEDAGKLSSDAREQRDAQVALSPPHSEARAYADSADAGVVTMAVVEAPPPTVEHASQVPAWAVPLLGTYAMRTRFYARSALAGTQPIAHEQLALADIRHDAATGSVEMTQRICENRGTGKPLGRTLDFRLLFPARYPEQRFSLRYKDGLWETQRSPTPVGYVEQVAGCVPGARIARQPAQSWLRDATCSCPTNDAAPTREDDCRLIDPDSDAKPGFTVELSGVATGVEYTVLKDFSQLVHGTISASDRRHTAHYSVLEEYERIQCVGYSCQEENAVDCPPTFNPVTFAPIPDGEHGEPAWGCDEILRAADAGTLLPAAPLANVPTGC
jgi:hypothetical protein